MQPLDLFPQLTRPHDQLIGTLGRAVRRANAQQFKNGLSFHLSCCSVLSDHFWGDFKGGCEQLGSHQLTHPLCSKYCQLIHSNFNRGLNVNAHCHCHHAGLQRCQSRSSSDEIRSEPTQNRSRIDRLQRRLYR